MVLRRPYVLAETIPRLVCARQVLYPLCSSSYETFFHSFLLDAGGLDGGDLGASKYKLLVVLRAPYAVAGTEVRFVSFQSALGATVFPPA